MIVISTQMYKVPLMARPKSGILREQKGMRLRPDIVRALKHLSIDLGRPLNVLVEEAAEEFLEKHRRKPG
jgi:hypothetical protein